nr:MAG TPA: hypothetical protein [Caudoviricetes sp.]
MRLNSTNLKQVGGGRIVKQGDSASLFEYKLLDEDHKPVEELNGTDAKITLYNASGKVSIDTTVTNSCIAFKLAKPLPIGLYTVEVVAGGYVFPSDRRTTLEVTQSADEYQPIEMIELGRLNIREEIASYMANHTVSAYNDAPLTKRIEALEARPQATTIDIGPLERRVQELENKPAPTAPAVDLSAYMTSDKAYQTFATYSALQSQMTSNIKNKHLELGIDALIDDKLKNGGNPFVTKSEIPVIDTSQLASKNDLEELKRSVGSGSGGSTAFGDNYPYDGDNINMLRNIPVGSTYVDRLKKNGAVKWIKTQMYDANATRDQAKNCWRVLFGDTGDVRMPMTGSILNTSTLTFRRINNIVELTWGGLTWGWFGIKRRGAVGYEPHPSNKEKFVIIVRSGNIKSGFIPNGSKLGYIMNDAGITQGTFYVSGRTDGSHVRLQFLNDVPTDRDIGDLRFTNMTYTTDDPWPETL